MEVKFISEEGEEFVAPGKLAHDMIGLVSAFGASEFKLDYPSRIVKLMVYALKSQFDQPSRPVYPMDGMRTYENRQKPWYCLALNCVRVFRELLPCDALQLIKLSDRLSYSDLTADLIFVIGRGLERFGLEYLDGNVTTQMMAQSYVIHGATYSRMSMDLLPALLERIPPHLAKEIMKQFWNGHSTEVMSIEELVFMDCPGYAMMMACREGFIRDKSPNEFARLGLTSAHMDKMMPHLIKHGNVELFQWAQTISKPRDDSIFHILSRPDLWRHLVVDDFDAIMWSLVSVWHTPKDYLNNPHVDLDELDPQKTDMLNLRVPSQRAYRRKLCHDEIKHRGTLAILARCDDPLKHQGVIGDLMLRFRLRGLPKLFVEALCIVEKLCGKADTMMRFEMVNHPVFCGAVLAEIKERDLKDLQRMFEGFCAAWAGWDGKQAKESGVECKSQFEKSALRMIDLAMGRRMQDLLSNDDIQWLCEAPCRFDLMKRLPFITDKAWAFTKSLENDAFELLGHLSDKLSEATMREAYMGCALSLRVEDWLQRKGLKTLRPDIILHHEFSAERVAYCLAKFPQKRLEYLNAGLRFRHDAVFGILAEMKMPVEILWSFVTHKPRFSFRLTSCNGLRHFMSVTSPEQKALLREMGLPD